MKRPKPNFKNTLGIIIGGGEGNRLWPITASVPKPAVPVGADYVMLDFPISSLLNSGFGKIVLIAQHLPHVITEHVNSYPAIFASGRGEFGSVRMPFYQQDQFLSDQHALRRVHEFLELDGIDYVILLNADQIWALDFEQVFDEMFKVGAHATLVYKKVGIEEARKKLGVVKLSESGLVESMAEKPENPYPDSFDPTQTCANTAIYCMDKQAYIEMIAHIADADPGPNLSNTGIQWLIGQKEVLGYDIASNIIDNSADFQQGFWFDAGTHETYLEVQKLLAVKGGRHFNLYNEKWPIYRGVPGNVYPGPVKLDAAICEASLLGAGVILAQDTELYNSVLSPGTRVFDKSTLETVVTLRNCQIGTGSVLKKVILGEGVCVPPGTVLGGGYYPEGTLDFDEAIVRLQSGKRPVPVPIKTESGILVIPARWKF